MPNITSEVQLSTYDAFEAQKSLARINIAVTSLEKFGPLKRRLGFACLERSGILNPSELTTVRALVGIQGI